MRLLPSGLLVFLLTIPGLALATVGAGQPSFGHLLFSLGSLIGIAKIAGLPSGRLGQPSVLGELLVGIFLGNAASSLLTGGGVAFVRSEPTP